MRRSKSFLALLCAITLLLPINLNFANAAVKAGDACPKLKTTSTVKGLKYTCIKSGNKLVWSKGVKVAAKPTATPTSSPDLPKQTITYGGPSEFTVGTQSKLDIRTQANSNYRLAIGVANNCSLISLYVVEFIKVGDCTLVVSTEETNEYQASNLIIVLRVVAAAPTPTPTPTPAPVVTPTPIATPSPAPNSGKK